MSQCLDMRQTGSVPWRKLIELTTTTTTWRVKIDLNACVVGKQYYSICRLESAFALAPAPHHPLAPTPLSPLLLFLPEALQSPTVAAGFANFPGEI